MTTEERVSAKWRDEFVLAMRVRDADGAAIGDALAEVEEFCRDTGQDVAEAFGAPDEYAERVTASPATWDVSWREGLTPHLLVQVAGMSLLLWSVSSDDGRLTLRLGLLLSAALMSSAAVLVVRTAGPRFRLLRTWLVVLATFAAVGAVGALLTRPVAVVPVAAAVAVGVTLLVGGALWNTWVQWRSPTSDVVTSPWDDRESVRRRNLRWSIALAWLLPAMTLVGVGGLALLDLAFDAAS